jgi:Acyl-CoA reductase (LuxC)
MKLQHRIDLLTELGQYILRDSEELQEAKFKAGAENGWFTPEFLDQALRNIAVAFLQKEALEKWVAAYPALSPDFTSKKIGIIMAGNIPLVGFHDWLSVFISGHQAYVKPSSKDQTLIKHLVKKLAEWEPRTDTQTVFSEMLKGCDAYIATGSNNSSRYFEYYFGKYPHIIRKNKTSAAVLTGLENTAALEALADDVHLYFGLGCRNVTKIYIPEGYDFVPLLEAFRKYSYLADHHKYKNNYDYTLAIHILNKQYYMTNGAILLSENPSFFSPISQLNYEFYTDKNALDRQLQGHDDLQGIVGDGYIPFGQGQRPALDQYADGVDTLEFLAGL